VWWGDTDACKVLKSMALSLGTGENVFFILSSSTLTPDTLASQRAVIAVQIHVLRLQPQFGCAEAVGLLQVASVLSAYLTSCVSLVNGR
jgi:hypothetical protein